MRWKVNHRRHQAAHTLPEAIIAALVGGMMLISLYAGFSSGFTLVQSSREELRASQILQDRIECIRLYSWVQIQDTNKFLKPTFTEYYNPAGLSNQTSGVTYAGRVSTNAPSWIPGSTDYRGNLVGITVKVYWTNVMNGQQVVLSRQLQTVVARYGTQVHEY